MISVVSPHTEDVQNPEYTEKRKKPTMFELKTCYKIYRDKICLIFPRPFKCCKQFYGEVVNYTGNQEIVYLRYSWIVWIIMKYSCVLLL